MVFTLGHYPMSTIGWSLEEIVWLAETMMAGYRAKRRAFWAVMRVRGILSARRRVIFSTITLCCSIALLHGFFGEKIYRSTVSLNFICPDCQKSFIVLGGCKCL